MTQTELFKLLGAPLHNARWSWGALGKDEAVFLRVWQDQERKYEGAWFAQVTYGDPLDDEEAILGHSERLEHVQRILDGAPSYMIMCRARDTKAIPRKIMSFNRREVFVGGGWSTWMAPIGSSAAIGFRSTMQDSGKSNQVRWRPTSKVRL